MQLAGLLAVGVVALALSDAEWLVRCGSFLLAAVLWLTLSGRFGYAGAEARDWVALLPFAVALAVREGFTLHSVQEIEIQFAQGPVGRHSVVYPLLQLFFAPLVRDPHAFTMHLNGVLGAVACLGMYQFVRQRLASRSAGFLCALFLATHPLLARFSPTDGPYAMLLAAWFCGLALLAPPHADARGLFGGAVLLGIAATTRMEGLVFLAAAALLLDLRQLLAAARRHPDATRAGLLAMALFVTLQMAVLLPLHLGGPTSLGGLIPSSHALYESAIWPASYNAGIFTRLVSLGALFGLVTRGHLGLWAFLAMLIVLAPVADSWILGPIALHRMIPACALQTLLAGLGAYGLTAWIPLPSRWGWLRVLPGAALAVAVLVQQRDTLTRPYVFTQEYDLVRRNLPPDGAAHRGCTLLTFNWLAGYDIDLHNIAQVVDDMRVVDCRARDCRAEAMRGPCVYYVRS
ncbi:MAG: hypothetical protein ABI629_05055, partial [bacterium]